VYLDDRRTLLARGIGGKRAISTFGPRVGKYHFYENLNFKNLILAIFGYFDILTKKGVTSNYHLKS